MYHFIVNIAGGSGKAKKTWDKVSSILDKNNIEYTLHKSEYAGHAKIIAKELQIEYIDILVMYRAITLKALRLGIDMEDENAYGFLSFRYKFEIA